VNNGPAVIGDQEGVSETTTLTPTAVIHADIILPPTIARALGGRLPRELLEDRMSTLLDVIGQHNGRILGRTDLSVAARFEDVNEAVKSAINLKIDSDRRRLTDQHSMIVRIVVDSVWSESKRITTDSPPNDLLRIWQILEEGGVLVSTAVRASTGIEGVEFKEPEISGGVSRYFILRWRDGVSFRPGSAVQGERFVHARSLARGDKPPCFYCGSKGHQPSGCPSKVLPLVTHGLHALGSMKIRQINAAFQQYIAEGDDLLRQQPDPGRPEKATPASMAGHAFYELTRVFQLRFLNATWDVQQYASWQHVRNSDKMPLTGGKLRLAFDCLRTFQTDQAEEILKTIEWSNPRDFRFHCLMGFVSVERNALTMATHFFTKAYEYSLSQPQKIHTLLLRYRAFALDGRKRQAEEVLSLCVSLDQTCPEALFEDILSKIGTEKGKRASRLIESLVTGTNEYWTAGIISPDLSRHFDIIGPELAKLLDEVRQEGRGFLKEANEILLNLRKILPEEDNELQESEREYADLSDRASVDTFFGWRNVIKSASRLVTRIRRLSADRQNKMQRTFLGLIARTHVIMESAHASHSSVTGRVEEIRRGIAEIENDLRNWQPHGQLIERSASLARQLEAVESKIMFLERADLRIDRLRAFIKNFVLFFGATSLSVIGLILSFLYFSKGILDTLREPGAGLIFNTLALFILLSSVIFASIRTMVKGHPLQRQKTGTGRG
jgi:hypothetical protein